jgi:putative tryptophan/tyrosine transport system substrate-binding protein
MKRRTLVIGSLAILGMPRMATLASGHVPAQSAKKVWRVGYLSMSSPNGDRHLVAAFRQGLRELGYVEGQNLILEQRHAVNQLDQAADFAAELAKREVAVIVIYGSPAVPIAQKTGLPVVMTVHADPVGSGLVSSLARPGGNLTGLMDGHADIAPKRLEILKEAVPSASRVAALFNPRTPHALRQWKLIEAAAPRLSVAVTPIEIKSADAIEHTFDTAAKARADALFIIPDPSWSAGNEQRIANLAIARRLPAIGTIREFAQRGALVAYGTNFTELWRRSAAYVDKILKGAKPGDLPIEHPTKFDLVINLKTAKALGITVPRALVLRADDVIE